jgi:hypothetical protein
MESAMVEAEPVTVTMKNQSWWYESYSMFLLEHSVVSILRNTIVRELRRVCDLELWRAGSSLLGAYCKEGHWGIK